MWDIDGFYQCHMHGEIVGSSMGKEIEDLHLDDLLM